MEASKGKVGGALAAVLAMIGVKGCGALGKMAIVGGEEAVKAASHVAPTASHLIPAAEHVVTGAGAAVTHAAAQETVGHVAEAAAHVGLQTAQHSSNLVEDGGKVVVKALGKSRMSDSERIVEATKNVARQKVNALRYTQHRRRDDDKKKDPLR